MERETGEEIQTDRRRATDRQVGTVEIRESERKSPLVIQSVLRTAKLPSVSVFL